MALFKKLSDKEISEFRAWARSNYAPFTDINGVWHYVIQNECAKMNEEIDKCLAIKKMTNDELLTEYNRITGDNEQDLRYLEEITHEMTKREE